MFSIADPFCIDLNVLSELIILFQTLLVAHNLLEEVEHGALDGMDSLRNLDLNTNLLTSAPNISHVCDTLTSLVLMNNSISEIPDFYFLNCTKLVNLNLEINLIESLGENSLRGLVSITRLSFFRNKINHVACGAFQDMVILKKLYLTYNSLRGLPCFQQPYPALRTLDLSLNRITSITEQEVSHISHLTSMNLAYNDLADVNFLHGLPDLMTVNAYLNNGVMMDPLTFENSWNITIYTMNDAGLKVFPVLGLSKLVIRKIEIGGHRVSCIDIDHVTYMGKLVTLYMRNGRLERFPDPGCADYFPGSQSTLNNVSFPNLTSVDIGYNSLYEFPWLPGMPDNSEIYLDYNRITSFPPERLGLLHRVRKLNLTFNRADEFPDFSQLPLSNKLTYLTLSHNRIRSVNHSHISMLQRLYLLTLDHNQIPMLPDMTFAAGSLVNFPLNHNLLPGLRPVITTDDSHWRITFWLVHDNNITDIPKQLLEQMPRLQIIRAEYNSITVLPFLTAVGSTLEIANFSNNLIDTVHYENLQKMTSLQLLNLSKNFIQFFPFTALANMPILQQLLLQENLLVSLYDLSWLSPQPSFVLNITSNPLNCSVELCWLRRFTGFTILKEVYLCSDPPLDAIVFDDITDVQMDCFCELSTLQMRI